MKWRNPAEARDKLYLFANDQAGYFTAGQALQAGYSRPLHTYHCRRRDWLRIDRAIYRLRNFPHGHFEDLVRWILWSGGQAVVSHETAAVVYDLGDVMPARIHLTLPPGFRKKVTGGIIVHRARLADQEVVLREGVRVTAPLRTILDLAADALESDWLAGVTRDALAHGLVSRQELESGLPTLDILSRERMQRILRRAEERPLAI